MHAEKLFALGVLWFAQQNPFVEFLLEPSSGGSVLLLIHAKQSVEQQKKIWLAQVVGGLDCFVLCKQFEQLETLAHVAAS